MKADFPDQARCFTPLSVWTAIAFLLVFPCSLSGQATPIPLPPEGHPRLYLLSEDLPHLRERITRPPHSAVWEDIVESDDYLARALVYLVGRDTEVGLDAIAAALDDLHSPDAFERTRGFDSPYHKTACVYDWCYFLLTDDQKQQFIDQFIALALQPNRRGTVYFGYPARMDANVATGHQSEGYLLTSQLPAGIAIYDENQLLYDAAAKLFFDRFVPVRNFHYAGHTHHQGTFYGVGRFHYDANAAWLFRAMGAGDVFSEEQRFIPYYYIYMTRPDGTSFPVGDAIASGNPDRVYDKIGSYYRDPYLLRLADSRSAGDMGVVFDLLFRDYTTSSRPISELPLTKYFPSPGSAMVAFNLKNDTYPAALVVFDRVEATEAPFEKTWLLHSIQEPSISGGTTHIVRTGPNEGTRRIDMPPGTEYGGRLVIESLLPKNASISKIGGTGKDFWIESAGRNFPPEIKPNKGKAFHPGAWRIEISPTTESLSDRFLNVMTAMDAETLQGPPTELLEQSDMIGARVHNRIVFFSDTAERKTALELDIPAGGPFGVLICDLAPGTYTAERDGQAVASGLESTESDGCIYFQADAGLLSISRTLENAPTVEEPNFWRMLRATLQPGTEVSQLKLNHSAGEESIELTYQRFGHGILPRSFIESSATLQPNQWMQADETNIHGTKDDGYEQMSVTLPRAGERQFFRLRQHP